MTDAPLPGAATAALAVALDLLLGKPRRWHLANHKGRAMPAKVPVHGYDIHAGSSHPRPGERPAAADAGRGRPIRQSAPTP